MARYILTALAIIAVILYDWLHIDTKYLVYAVIVLACLVAGIVWDSTSGRASGRYYDEE
jgi:Flp pilus assembly protein TadB